MTRARRDVEEMKITQAFRKQKARTAGEATAGAGEVVVDGKRQRKKKGRKRGKKESGWGGL